mmetsp:Transcript_15902/g.34817  ORF Transcript_15902/g.34817 Transcript_15902/m.34817 type:complete len:226 (-) Transcript_15902:135-812(-)
MLCRRCVTPDPVHDTVFVDMAQPVAREMRRWGNDLLISESPSDAAKALARAQAERLEREEKRQHRKEQERRQKDEEQKRRAQEEADRQHTVAKEAALKRRQEEAARERKFHQEQQAAARARVIEFLRANGFDCGLNTPKQGLMKTTYPLHAAVAKGDAEMIELLLKCRADSSLKASGQTALALAEKSNRKGSHEHVLAILRDSQATGIRISRGAARPSVSSAAEP